MNAASLPSDAMGWSESGYFQTRLSIAAMSGVLILFGVGMGQPAFVGAGAVGLCLMCRQVELFAGPRRDSRLTQLAAKLFNGCGPYTVEGSQPVPTTRGVSTYSPAGYGRGPGSSPPAARRTYEPTKGLVGEMLHTNRYALLLRPETISHLSEDERLRVIRALDERMALCPEGSVLVGMAAERATLGDAAASMPSPSALGEGVQKVEACYLDRWTVTNADYQQFVDAGGYEQLEYWAEEALPALFDFVDTTGTSAPRYWVEGQFAPGDAHLPVVGVSWYEAQAYARWVGKRLPHDAEWTKACAWPIESAPGRIAQRRYPWGESFDARRANLWCTGQGGPVDVGAFPEGATVSGVDQMVGNVWEWTNDPLDSATPSSVQFPSALRSIRGGAFNTYFENQATCHYQSGENPLARRANIGIRLALDMAVLASTADASPPPIEVE